MNKSELVEQVGELTGLERRQASRAVEATLAAIKGALLNGDKISLVGFGSFETRSREPREGRNPKTGERVQVGPSTGVKFSPSPAFRKELNER